jgi:hypothetical protein
MVLVLHYGLCSSRVERAFGFVRQRDVENRSARLDVVIPAPKFGKLVKRISNAVVVHCDTSVSPRILSSAKSTPAVVRSMHEAYLGPPAGLVVCRLARRSRIGRPHVWTRQPPRAFRVGCQARLPQYHPGPWPPHTQFLAWPVDNVCRTAVAVRQRSRAATLASTVGLVMVTGRC